MLLELYLLERLYPEKLEGLNEQNVCEAYDLKRKDCRITRDVLDKGDFFEMVPAERKPLGDPNATYISSYSETNKTPALDPGIFGLNNNKASGYLLTVNEYNLFLPYGVPRFSADLILVVEDLQVASTEITENDFTNGDNATCVQAARLVNEEIKIGEQHFPMGSKLVMIDGCSQQNSENPIVY